MRLKKPSDAVTWTSCIEWSPGVSSVTVTSVPGATAGFRIRSEPVRSMSRWSVGSLTGSVPFPVAVRDRNPRVIVALAFETTNWNLPVRLTLSRKKADACAFRFPLWPAARPRFVIAPFALPSVYVSGTVIPSDVI